MTLKNYISELKELVEQDGDLEVVYSSDDEGNSYHKVMYAPCVEFLMIDGKEEHVVCLN